MRTVPTIRAATHALCLAVAACGRVGFLDTRLLVSSVSPSSGPAVGGQTITFLGYNFAQGMSVHLGGTPCAPVVVHSATELSCITGASIEGSVDIELQHAATQRKTVLQGAYVYSTQLDNPDPSDPSDVQLELSDVQPSQGTEAGGTLIRVTGEGFAPGATVTLDGVACLGTTWLSSVELECNTPPHAVGSVAVTVTNPDGDSAALTNAFTYDPAGQLPPGGAVAFVILPPTNRYVGQQVAVTIEARTEADVLDDTFDATPGVTLVASGGAAGAGAVDFIAGVGTATLTNTVAETVALSLVDSEGTGLDVSSTADVAFLQIPVSTFIILDPSDGFVGDDIEVTIVAQRSDGTTATEYDSSPGVTLVATGTVTGAGPVSFTAGVGAQTLTSRHPGTMTLSLDDSENTAADVSSSQDIIFSPGAGGTPFTDTWDFSNPLDYTYDSSSIEVVSGEARLIAFDQMDSDFSVTGFGGGTVANGAPVGDVTSRLVYVTDHLELTLTPTELPAAGTWPLDTSGLQALFRLDEAVGPPPDPVIFTDEVSGLTTTNCKPTCPTYGAAAFVGNGIAGSSSVHFSAPALDTVGTLSLSVWVNPSSKCQDGPIVAKAPAASRWQMLYDLSCDLRWQVGATSITARTRGIL